MNVHVHGLRPVPANLSLYNWRGDYTPLIKGTPCTDYYIRRAIYKRKHHNYIQLDDYKDQFISLQIANQIHSFTTKSIIRYRVNSRFHIAVAAGTVFSSSMVDSGFFEMFGISFD